MAVVSEINVRTQIGLESSLGGAGACGKRLQALMIQPGPALDAKTITAQGHRAPSGTAVDKEWTEFDVPSSRALYTESLYLYENFFGSVSPTTVGTAGKRRVYSLALTGGITPKGWTSQFGDAADNVNQYGYGILTDLTKTWDRDNGVNVSGKGLAQLISTGGTFTSSAGVLANKPILGSHLNVYLDTTGAGIGTTQITDEILSVEMDLTGLRDVRWAMDRAQTSWKAHVDIYPTLQCKIDLAESAVTRAIIAALKTGQTYFMRVDALGDQIETSLNYGDVTDVAMQILTITKFESSKGVWKRQITTQIVEDPTWNAAVKITNTTTESSL